MQDLNDKINNGGATAAGQLDADEWNQIPSEIQNAIVSSGKALSGGNLSQLVEAIAQYASVGTFFTGAGITDAYTANAVTPAVAPPSLKDGMIVRFIVPASNAGASTLNAFTHGIIDIKLDGGLTDPPAGAMTIGQEAEVVYRLTPSPHWELQFIEKDGIPTGSLLIMDGDVVPIGYLKRNGALLSRTTYANLWAYAQTISNLISQATKDGDPQTYAGYYGDGDGSTTFTLPDARGELIRALDDGRGIDSGRFIGSWQVGTVHSFDIGTAVASITDRDVGVTDSTTAKSNMGLDNANVSDYPASAGFTSSSGSSNLLENTSEIAFGSTRPRNIAYLFCVKF